MKKISFNVSDVLPSLMQVCNVATPKGVVPILSDVIISTFVGKESTSLLMTASNGDSWLSMRCPLVEGDSNFSIAINAQDSLRALTNLVGHIVTMEVEDGKNTVKCRHENGFFSLPIDVEDEFPSSPSDSVNMKATDIDAVRLRAAIAATKGSMSEDALHPILNGIHFDFFTDKMVCASLNYVTMEKYSDYEVGGQEEYTSFNLPSKASLVVFSLLNKANGTVRLQWDNNNVVIRHSTFRFVTKQMEGNYPPYEKLFNTDFPLSATLSCELLSNSLKRVMPLGDAVSRLATLRFDKNKMTISSEDVVSNKSAIETVDCTFNQPAFEVNLKVSLVLSLLSNIESENVIFKMSTPTTPVLIEPEIQTEGVGLSCLIMPMLNV